MNVFARLKKIREFTRASLPGVSSIEDFDIVLEIGASQESGQPMNPKRLALLEIASPATVNRRLNRLVELGIIIKQVSQRDGRLIELRIAPDIVQIYRAYARLLQRPGKAKTFYVGPLKRATFPYNRRAIPPPSTIPRRPHEQV